MTGDSLGSAERPVLCHNDASPFATFCHQTPYLATHAVTHTVTLPAVLMQPFIVLLVLFSALLHATWNAFLHTSGDSVWQFGMMSFPYLVCSATVLLFVPAPARESWPYIAASAALQLGYCVALAKAYKAGDFGQIYPIARGLSPLLVFAGAFVLACEHERAREYEQRREAARNGINLPEVTSLVGLRQGHAITELQSRRCRDVRPAFARRRGHEQQHDRRTHEVGERHHAELPHAVAAGVQEGVPGGVQQRGEQNKQDDERLHQDRGKGDGMGNRVRGKVRRLMAKSGKRRSRHYGRERELPLAQAPPAMTVSFDHALRGLRPTAPRFSCLLSLSRNPCAWVLPQTDYITAPVLATLHF